MLFWKDIILPILIIALAVLLIELILNLILRAIKLDMTILRIVGFFVIWYFIGPIIYDWLATHVLTVQHEAIEVLYMPIQHIIDYLSKLV